MASSSVVFPDPLGPMTITTAPRGTSNVPAGPHDLTVPGHGGVFEMQGRRARPEGSAGLMTTSAADRARS